MMPPVPALDRYLAARSFPGPWVLEGERGSRFRGAVVIPSLAESETLPATLASLADNPPELLERFLIVVVVNHRTDAPDADQADNRLTLKWLAAGNYPAGLRLAWVDAAAPGRELPAGEGVGLARKLGFDLALSRLDWQTRPLLLSLDADTLVQTDYFPAVLRHFERCRAGGATVPFRHRPAPTPEAEAAIVRYELFLRHYVLGLTLAGSPYAYHTVGSAIACRASAYLDAGGIPRRQAGEDFYFLQQLAKTAGVESLCGTVVHPSPRPSRRVPFGTGPSVARLLAGEEQAVLFYPAATFSVLKRWLQTVTEHPEDSGDSLLAAAALIDRQLLNYLAAAGFSQVWQRLCRNHPHPLRRLRAFHGWFDGLKTLRLIHHLCRESCPRGEPDTAIRDLFCQAGFPPQRNLRDQLRELRRVQGANEDLPTI